MLPRNTRRDLRDFIRYIDEVPDIAEASIFAKGSNGVELIANAFEDSAGFCALLEVGGRDRTDILLSSVHLVGFDEAAVIGTILHEVAHAEDYLVYPKEAVTRSEYDSERVAWLRAWQWALASGENALNGRVQIWCRLCLVEDQTRYDNESLPNQ